MFVGIFIFWYNSSEKDTNLMIFSPMKNINKMKLFFASAITLAVVLFSGSVAHAGDPNLPIQNSSYKATYVSQTLPDPIQIEAGETREVVISFKNTGSAVWSSSGGRHISAYTVEPKYNESEFFTSGWVSKMQTGLIKGVVRPGEIGKLSIKLKAPTKPGEYIERFHLAAEDTTWVDNGYFFLIINVVEKTEAVEPTPPKVEEPTTEPESKPETVENPDAYKANRFMQSKKSISVEGGEKVVMILGFQNTGTATWKSARITSGEQTKLAGTSISFADHSWADRSLVLETPVEILPGKVLRQHVAFRAPKKKGNYDAHFTLEVDGKTVGNATVKVAVTDNAPVNYKEPTFDSDKEDYVKPKTPKLSAEPRIRVGINVDDLKVLHFYSGEDDYEVFIGDKRKSKGILPRKKIAELRYDGGFFAFKGGDMQFSSEDYIRLEPVNNKHAVHQLMNVERKVAYVGNGLFNDYRGAMEYRVGTVDKKKYAVNDLLFEDYVKGIAEFARNDEMEFIKANVVAARTYAYKSLGKYPFFDVLSNTYDQLYLGSQVEKFMPRATEAVEATRGLMVSYKDEVVITPYFGNSNGSTKSWKQVWGGTHKPWLVPVKTEYDAGRRQYGHGVGMSQRDANLRAKDTGATFEELIKHYYTDTELAFMYN